MDNKIVASCVTSISLERYDQISIAKGMGILLMVIGHLECSDVVVRLIYLFHMPLFVCCSGYCFKDKYLKDAKTYFVRKVKGLYFPFVLWTTIFVLLHNLFCRWNLINESYSLSVNIAHPFTSGEMKEKIMAAFFKMQVTEDIISPLWFLRSLFLGSVFAYLVLRISRKWWIRFIVPLLCAIIVSFFTAKIRFFNEIKTFCFFGFFFISGYWFKEKFGKINERKLIIQVSEIVIGISLVLMGYFFWPVIVSSVTCRTIVPYAISALGGSLVIWRFCGFVSKESSHLRKVLVYIGNNTMPILIFHILSFKVVSLFIIRVYNLPIEMLADYGTIAGYSKIGWWAMYLVVGITLPILVNALYNKVKCHILR